MSIVGQYEASLRTHYIEARRRLTTLPKPPVQLPPPTPALPPMDEAALARREEFRQAFERVARGSRIIHEVAEKYGLRPDEITSRGRFKRLIPARHECCFRLVVECGLSYPRAGLRFGGLDHTTILNACRRHAETSPEAAEAWRKHLAGETEAGKAAAHRRAIATGRIYGSQE